MSVVLTRILKSIVIAMLLSQSGCGALQLGWHAPDNEREDWSEWKQCFGTNPFSKGGITHSVFCLEGERSKPPLLLLHELNGLTPGILGAGLAIKHLPDCSWPTPAPLIGS